MSKNSTPKQAQPLDPDLLRAHKAYEAAINSNDTDQVMAMYDKDAMVMQPDGETVSGLDNIRQWVDEYFGAYQTHWTKVVTMNWVSGDFGFDQGHDTAVDTPRNGGGCDPLGLQGHTDLQATEERRLAGVPRHLEQQQAAIDGRLKFDPQPCAHAGSSQGAVGVTRSLSPLEAAHDGFCLGGDGPGDPKAVVTPGRSLVSAAPRVHG